MSSCIAADASLSSAKPAWRAVYALALGVFGLIVAEFLPASLLTPMASSLGVSEGMAGQAVTATALVALVTGLLIATATRNIDRRWVLMFFSILQIVSSLMVAFADSLAFLLLGRLLLGIAIGGFWAMSTATAMRLVPAAHVPKALAIIFSAVSVATVVAAPLGSYLGELIGWRNVFILCAIPSLLALLWQLWVLPSMRPESVGTFSTLFRVLRRPGMLGGMLATILIFSGHFAFFTYLRPFLETVAQASIEGVSLILLGFGVANFIGTSVASYLLSRSLRLTLALVPLMMSVLALVPLMMSVLALLMVTFGHLTVLAGLLVALWGFAFGLVPVAWSTWLATTVPDEAESAGGLLVASIQLAISAGAAGGGAVFDLHGASGVFTGSGLLLLSAMVIVFAAVRVKPVARADQPVTGRLSREIDN
ncbi:TPA: MFS transporter [Klebsiella pneumoniae]|nr:MFS transporter [Klebsiella pneumoniae]